ncbi:hypothetical protein BC826DRAFT_1105757 [Russula brevipes]|nr:hypothetical protein BC826DRAFT_1105757 [Russula brevipes]
MAAAIVTSKISAVPIPRHILSSRASVNSDPPPPPAVHSPPSRPPPSKSSRSPLPPPPPPPTLPATRSRSVHPEGMSQPAPAPSTPAPMSLKRLLRSPFEHTIRSAARSKGKPATTSSSPPCDDFATITAKDDSRGAKTSAHVKVTEVISGEDGGKGDKERTGMFKRFETRVALRRTRKLSATEPSRDAVPPPTLNHQSGDLEGGNDCLPPEHRFRLPGFTSFVPPSLRLASLSSPALNLSSLASPSPPPSSPTRPIISPPAPLTPKRPSVANAGSSPSPPSSRSRKSRPAPLLPSSPSTPSLDRFASSPSPAPTTPTRPGSRDPVSPGTPSTPPSSSRNPQQQRQQLGKRSSAGAAAPSPDQPHSSPTSSRTRSPSSRVVTPRGFASASTSSLNYPPSYPTNAIRRSSVDRRSPSPALRASSPASPSRPRALSPTRQHQRAVSPSAVLMRHANGSTTSISAAGPSNPMHREAVRVASSVLCKEMLRPGKTTGLGERESEEVEVRMRALAALSVFGERAAQSLQMGASRS